MSKLIKHRKKIMKAYILLVVLVMCGFMVLAYAMNKHLDQRCEYFKGLANYQTDKELQHTCP